MRGMAEERMGTPEGETRTYWAWTELFRTFQVALDPKKLLLAAAGIFVMWVGWWLLAIAFAARGPNRMNQIMTQPHIRRFTRTCRRSRSRR